MPRRRRLCPDGAIHHVLNRGNTRAAIFHEDADYDAFFNLLADAMRRVPMRILAVCLMPNHFHLVLWPIRGADLPAYMHALLNVHVRRYRTHSETVGLGHVYQGRYKNFVVQGDVHLYNVLRYVEGNALRAGLVTAAQLWRWSSLARGFTPDGRSYLSDWPIPRPSNWTSYVNAQIPSSELHVLQRSVARNVPYGEQSWVEDVVQRARREARFFPQTLSNLVSFSP